MRQIFGSKGADGEGKGGARVARHSSGWAHLAEELRGREGLRVLDIGPTSSVNINYITSLGHSIYMANLVDEAGKPEWRKKDEPEDFDVEGFMKANLEFSGRAFDIVLFWDTADYLPKALVAPVIARLHKVMEPGGKLLSFFHVKFEDAGFSRYHLTDRDDVEMQRAGTNPIVGTYNNREIENLFQAFAGHRFFLAKDNLREVVVTR